jgi:hypothetical protein
VVEAVATALGHCGDADAVEPLAGLLDHKVRSVRSAVVQALGDIGDRSAGVALTEVLSSSTDPGMQTRAAVALAKCGHVDALPRLYEALVHLESVASRRQVANAMGALMGDAHTYRLLASDAMAREPAIVRRIRALGRRPQSGDVGSSRRRTSLMDRAAQAYADGDLRTAGGLILRGACRGGGPASELADTARDRLRAQDPTEEEFIVILAVAAKADRLGESEGA